MRSANSPRQAPDLDGRYRRLLAEYPQRSELLPGDQCWSWIDTGAGRQALVLLPGFMGEAGTSFLYIVALASLARVVSVSYPPSVGQVEPLCDGLAGLLDRLGLGQVTLLGGSSSGFLAQAFVRRHPGRCAGLILTHTGLPDPARARTARGYLRLLRILPFGLLRRVMQFSLHAYFPRRSPTHAFWRAHFQQIIGCQTAQSLRSRFALMADFHARFRFAPGDLAGWPGELLLMEMQRDRLTTPDEQLAMRRLYPTARLRILSAAAHFDSVEQPQEQIEIIAEFLRSMQG